MFRRKQKEMSQHFCWLICCLCGCEYPKDNFLSGLYGYTEV